EAIDWLEDREPDSPFFTCLWFSEPHTPVLAADEFRSLYPEETTEPYLASLAKSGGPQVKRRDRLRDPDLYFGCISMLDHHIGRLLDYLVAAGLSDNTIVVFTSDNGPEHRTATAFGSSGDLRGAKGHIHEGGIRVPGIVRWPGVIKPGSISDEPVNGTDWMPTFSSIGGAKIPSDRPIDGADLLPLLSGKGVVTRPVPMMWWLWHARGGFEVAMRNGDYKMLATLLPQQNPGGFEDAIQPEGWSIMQFIKKAELGRFELFNLAEDGSEAENLSGDEPETFEAIKAKMIALHREIREEGPELELSRGKKMGD
ncbi:MAG: sulfatase-like hydrolase/transferase, partial [Verrucomicrobiota bacterium]